MKAFPYNREIPSDKEGYKAYASEDGIDMRDYFASDAMKGMLANPECDLNADETVNAAYRIAELMMKAREVNEKL